MSVNDFASLSRTTLVQLMIGERTNKIDHMLLTAPDIQAFGKIIRSLSDCPINPLFLSTALALELCGVESNEVFDKFVNGTPITGLEDRYLDLSSFGENLATILPVEAELVEAWCIVGLWQISRPFLFHSGEEKSRRLWSDIKEYRSDEKYEWIYWECLWNAWRMANPQTVLFGDNEDQCAGLYVYGFGNNSRFHNERERIEVRLNELRERINIVASTSGGLDNRGAEISLLRRDYRHWATLHDRSKLFYDWNPCETHAHWKTAFLKQELHKLVKGNPGQIDDEADDDAESKTPRSEFSSLTDRVKRWSISLSTWIQKRRPTSR